MATERSGQRGVRIDRCEIHRCWRQGNLDAREFGAK
jgi:hypothetical protein